LTATAESAAPAPGGGNPGAVKAASQRVTAALPKTAPRWIRTLAQASDQFIVRRQVIDASLGGTAGRASMSIIAGYPWFTDWAVTP